MEVGKAFDNLQSYNTSMAKAMNDKMFFVEKLPQDKHYIFVDFGCADGTMINNLIDVYGPHHIYVGYDCSQTMIDLAKTNYRENADSAVFTTNWDKVTSTLKVPRDCDYCTVIILSSVIHEVYSYSTGENDIKEFWNRVKNSGFDYIVVRDMMARKHMDRSAEDSDEYKKITNKLFYNMYTRTDAEYCLTRKMLKEFEEIHGSIKNMKNLIHFLLKYRWRTNWEREKNENYFPIYVEDFLKIIKEPLYQLIFFENFRVRFLDDCFRKDFDIQLEDNTHIKAIFKRV